MEHPWAAGLLCLGIILFFHSPRLSLLQSEVPGSFEWSRAGSYLKQCESPFRRDIEPAMQRRYLPQVFVWALGGNKMLALSIPWLGAWALLAYLASLMRRLENDGVIRLAGTLILGATSPVLVSTGWLGINDAWVALGLCYLAFGKNNFLLAAACILCPLIDERFIFGIPCALVIRHWSEEPGKFSATLLRSVGQSLIALSPFVLIRMAGSLFGQQAPVDRHFFLESIRGSSTYLWVAPLGIWMAMRMAYLPIIMHACEVFAVNRRMILLLLASAFVPLLVGIPLASDTARTAGILLPLATWSVLRTSAHFGRILWISLALATLLVSAAHVTYVNIMPINSLPVELWRLLR